MPSNFLMKLPKPLLYIVTGAGIIFGSWFLIPDWFGYNNEGDMGREREDTPPSLSSIVVKGEKDKQPEVSNAVAQEEEQATKSTDSSGVELQAPNSKQITQSDEYKSAVRLLEEKRFRAASIKLAKMVERFPEDATLRYQYSKALFSSHKRRRKAAIQQMKKSIELKQDYADAYYELGKMYVKLRNRGKARRFLLAFLKLSPYTQKADEAKALLRSIKHRK